MPVNAPTPISCTDTVAGSSTKASIFIVVGLDFIVTLVYLSCGIVRLLARKQKQNACNDLGGLIGIAEP